MKRPTIAKLTALLAALALVGAACGDSGSSSSTTTKAAGGSSTTAAGGSTTTGAAVACDSKLPTIKLGSVTEAKNYAGMEEAIIARIERENKTCIAGRKLEFVGTRDDASDIQKNLDGAKDLVENKKADALLITSAANVQTSAYLAQAKVPFFGWGFMPGFCGKPAETWGMSVNGCLSGWAFNKLGAVKLDNPPLPKGFAEAHQAVTGKKDYTLVIFQEKNEAGDAGKALYEQLFPKTSALASESLVMKADGSLDAAVVQQAVQTVLSKNPDMVMLSTSFGNAVAVGAALVGAGYKGKVQNFVAYAPGLLESSADLAKAFEGAYTVIQYPPIEDGGGTAIAADLKAAGKSDFVSLGAMIGWWNTDLAIALMKQAASKGTVTGATIQKAAADGFTYNPGAKSPQVKYPDNFAGPGGGPCRAVVKVENKKYVLTQGYTCF